MKLLLIFRNIENDISYIIKICVHAALCADYAYIFLQFAPAQKFKCMFFMLLEIIR